MNSILSSLWSRLMPFLRGSGGTAGRKSAGKAIRRGQGLDVFEGDDAGDLAINRYPPFDSGIPLNAVETIIQSQEQLINRLYRTAGLNRADFERLYMPPIRKLAEYIHLLPATPDTYFRGTGGLFRFSLDIALHSLQAANSSVFPTGGGVERRYHMQPRWCLATFLAGLCCQNYRTVNAMVVMSKDGDQWMPLLEPLIEWARGIRLKNYYVRWINDVQVHGAQASAAYSVSQIVSNDILQWLATDNNQIVPAMTAAVTGVESHASENPITRLVAPVITRVIEEDLRRTSTNYGHLVIGSHLEPHLVDAMRRLVSGGKWVANSSVNGRLWVGVEGTFIDWLPAAQDIINLLMRDAYGGIPRDPETLADLLSNAGLIAVHPKKGRYWTIAVPGTMEAKDGLLKLKDGSIIFPRGFDFEPFKSIQLAFDESTKPAPRPEAPAPATMQPREQAEQTAPKPAAEERPREPEVKRAPRKPKKAVTPSTEAGTQTNVAHQAVSPVKTTAPDAQASREAEPSNEMPPVDDVPPPDEIPERLQHADLDGQEVGVPVAPPRQSQEAAPDRSVDAQSPATPAAASVAPLDSRAEAMFASLRKHNAWLLQEIQRCMQTNALTGQVLWLKQGLGIDQVELSAHGQPMLELFEELALKQWLWVDSTKPSRKIHAIEKDGESLKMLILKPEIARSLGFEGQA